MSSDRLAGKVALVTGFGAGLGREIAACLAGEGASIGGLSRDVARGQATVASIEAEGGRALFAPADVRDAAQVDAAVASVAATLGGVDILVNAAGLRVTGTASDVAIADWSAAVDTNLTGTFLASRAVLPEFRKRGGGAIVNVSSISGMGGAPRRVAHSASKAGVHALTESMAIDHGPDNVRVNCVALGPIDTPRPGSDWRAGSGIADRVPLRKVGSPADVAEAIVYLCSDAASYVTGVVFPIDGGLHLIGGL